MIVFIPERAASIEKAGMSKSTGRQTEKRLVDMSTPPPPDPVYEPPEGAEEDNFPVDFGRPDMELKVGASVPWTVRLLRDHADVTDGRAIA
jgi:hypothetical protein